MSPLAGELAGAACLLLLFLAILGAAEVLARKGKLGPETARKCIHLLGGLGCLLFPFLLSSWITVCCLMLVFSSLFYFGEKRKMLRSLSSVERDTWGSLLFPVAVLLLFVFSHDRIWLYVSALLVLVLADTAAALAGTRYGRVFYRVGPTEQKSLEGTLSFFLVGFLAVCLSLLTLSDFPWLTCILTAFLMALLLAALEAVSIGGTDNILVPLATMFLLLKIPTKPANEILFQCLSCVGLSVLLIVLNRRDRTLQTRLLILFILCAFAAWSLGSVDWALPLVIGFMFYNGACTACLPLPDDLSALDLLRPMYPALFILFAANMTFDLGFMFAPYVVAVALAASLCVVNRYRIESPPRRMGGRTLVAAALLPAGLSLMVCLPFQGRTVLPAVPVVLALSAVTTLVYNRVISLPLSHAAWHYAIPLYAAAAASLVVVFQATGLVPAMEPTTWMGIFR